MKINMADRTQKWLIVEIKKHNHRLAAWLVKNNVQLELEQFSYGDTILNRETGKESPKVGIIAKGVVEIQGQIASPPKILKRIQYPLALRYPGEVIGEVEFLYHGLTKGPYRGRWIVYAGMQTFYFTPLKVINASCHEKLRHEMDLSKHNFKVEVAWLPPEVIREQEVVDALTETAFKRLASLTSFWQPLPDELDRMGKREMSQYLFLELVKAIQGARIAFKPFSSENMASVTPWNSDMLNRILKDKGCSEFKFEDCLVLGIHQPGDNEPFIILVHFLYESLANPSGKFKAPDLKNATEKIFTETLDIVKLLKTTVKDHPPNTNRHVIALYSKDGRYIKEIKDSKDSCQEDLIKHLVQILKVSPSKLSAASDLVKLGMLGSASLLVLPYNDKTHVTS